MGEDSAATLGVSVWQGASIRHGPVQGLVFPRGPPGCSFCFCRRLEATWGRLDEALALADVTSAAPRDEVPEKGAVAGSTTEPAASGAPALQDGHRPGTHRRREEKHVHGALSLAVGTAARTFALLALPRLHQLEKALFFELRPASLLLSLHLQSELFFLSSSLVVLGLLHASSELLLFSTPYSRDLCTAQSLALCLQLLCGHSCLVLNQHLRPLSLCTGLLPAAIPAMQSHPKLIVWKERTCKISRLDAVGGGKVFFLPSLL